MGVDTKPPTDAPPRHTDRWLGDLPLFPVALPLNRRLLLALGFGLLLVTALIVVFSVRWFLRPSSVTPDRADAVVVLAGGEGERLEHALSLMADAVAETLVLSVGNEVWPDAEAVTETCGEATFEVVCFTPNPDTTKAVSYTHLTLPTTSRV